MQTTRCWLQELCGSGTVQINEQTFIAQMYINYPIAPSRAGSTDATVTAAAPVPVFGFNVPTAGTASVPAPLAVNLILYEPIG